jgi:hypothetical protein
VLRLKKITIWLALLVLGLAATLSIETQTTVAQHTPEGKAFILVSPINITSPSNMTSISQPLTLNFSVKSYLKPEQSDIEFVYSIDGGKNTTVSLEVTPVPLEYTDANGKTSISIFSYHLISGYTTLPDIPIGPHNVTVYARYEFPSSNNNIGLDSSTIHFNLYGENVIDNTNAEIGGKKEAISSEMPSELALFPYFVAVVLTLGIVAVGIFFIKLKAKNKIR